MVQDQEQYIPAVTQVLLLIVSSKSRGLCSGFQKFHLFPFAFVLLGCRYTNIRFVALVTDCQVDYSCSGTDIQHWAILLPHLAGLAGLVISGML